MKQFLQMRSAQLKKVFLLTALACSFITHAQFTTGNLVVLQVGDAVNTLTNTGNPIILREFSTNGTPTFSVNIPSTGTTALISSGAATSEGMLTNSSNKKLLVFAGYAQVLPSSTSLSGSSSSVIPRGVGIVDATGGYTYAASSATFYSGNNPRGATSDGLNNYWGSGGVDGTDYYGNASTATNVQNVKANTRAVAIFSGQLYLSTQSASGAQTNLGIYAVGAGVPSTSGQTITSIINTGTGSQPVQFYFQPGLTPTVCYVADSRASTGGGVQKWVLSSGTWSLAYTIPTSTASLGANGVVADFSSSNPMVYATTVESSNNRLVSILDNGASATATTIATATTNAIFRGLAFSPCNTPSINSVAANGPICANQSLSLSVSATGGSLTSYAWAGAGAFSSGTATNPVVTGAQSGNYTVAATNGCGTSFSVVTVTVNPVPQVSATATSYSVCLGQTLTLSGAGATSYSWSGGITDNTPFTPTANTVYTVTGTASGCSGTTTVAVTINTVAITASSITICSGQSATLTGGGANTYTWSTSNNSSSIVVTPSVTATYTLTGTSASGCVGATTTQVVVTNSPVVTVNSATICAGTAATLAASGVNTYSWSNTATTAVIVVSPTTTTTYSIIGALSGCSGFANGSATVLVNPVPTLAVSGGTSTCAGGSLSQTVSGASTYSWSNGATGATVILSPTVSTVYVVTGTATSGCSSSINRSITVLASPTVSIIASSPTACAGSQVTLTAGGATTYSWNTSATTAAITVSPSSSTSYSVTGTNANGCISGTSLAITVIPAPGVSVTTSQATICAGQSVSLTATGAGSYSWSSGGSGSVIVVSPATNTVYTVTGTSQGCSASAQLTQSVSTCDGLANNKEIKAGLSIYPNPAGTVVYVKAEIREPATLKLVNALGQTVMQSTIGEAAETLDISHLPKGIYFVQLNSGSNNILKKLIIE